MLIKLHEIKSYIAGRIEKLKKPFIQYDFDIVESVYADENSEPLDRNGAQGSFKIRLCDVIIALTLLLAVFSIFSRKDD